MKQKRRPPRQERKSTHYQQGPELFFLPEDEPVGESYYDPNSSVQNWFDSTPSESQRIEKFIQDSIRKERADQIEMNRKAIASVTEKVGRPLGSSEVFAAMKAANLGYEACGKKLKSSPAAKNAPTPPSELKDQLGQLGWVAFMIGWKHRLWYRNELALAWT